MINLFVSYYQCGERKRQKELDFCWNHNQKNKLIDRIINFENRPKYSDFFLQTKNYPEDINILANADIYFDETLELVNKIKPNECYALTRWELEGKEVVPFESKHKYNQHAKCKHSQDVWIFRGTVRHVSGDFHLGRPGCDNRIAWEIQRAYSVLNPCYSIRCIHKHSEEKRNYSMPGVPRPWWHVEPCALGEQEVKREIRQGVRRVYR